MSRFLIAFLAGAALAAQSPMFRGGPARTGVYPPLGKELQGKVAWSIDPMDWTIYKTMEGAVGQPMWPTTPAVAGNQIFTCAGPFFCALDRMGKFLYRTRLGGASLSSPAVAGGTAFIPADDGLLYALDAQDGRILWTCRISAPSRLKLADAWDVYQSSPAVADGKVFVGGTDGQVVAVSATDGKVAWRFDTGDLIRSSPALADGKVFLGNFAGKIYCLDAETGARIWDQDTHVKGVPWHSVQGSCAVSGGIVFVGSRSTFFFALDEATGKILWKHSHEGSWVPSSPAVRDGVAYVGQSDGNKVTAIGADGKVRWVLETDNETFSSPSLSGNLLFVATNDNYNLNGKGSLSAVDVRTGKALWKCPFPASVWASPVVAEDAVYVACADGKVYAVK